VVLRLLGLHDLKQKGIINLTKTSNTYSPFCFPPPDRNHSHSVTVTCDLRLQIVPLFLFLNCRGLMFHQTPTQMESWSSKCEYNTESLKEQLSLMRSLLSPMNDLVVGKILSQDYGNEHTKSNWAMLHGDLFS